MTAMATWMQVHDDLDRALQVLRRVWPEGRASSRRQALEQLGAPLRLHMHLEETVLMPRYAALADELPPNAAPHVLKADHTKLRGHLDALADLVQAEGAPEILAAQEQLGRLAGVLEHHDLRENTWFVPTLEAGVPLATRRAWVAQFAEAEATLPAPEPLALSPRAPQAPDPALSPLDAFRMAIACDGDVGGTLARVLCPDHPRGPKLLARCARLVEAAERSGSLEARRDRLAELADVVRLLVIVAERPSVRPRA